MFFFAVRKGNTEIIKLLLTLNELNINASYIQIINFF